MQISGDEGWGKAGGSSEPSGEIELLMGRRYRVQDRAADTPDRRELVAVVEAAGATGRPLEETWVKGFGAEPTEKKWWSKWCKRSQHGIASTRNGIYT